MIPVDGVDLVNGGLAAHIWMMPIVDYSTALDKLLICKEQLKQSVYEIMGISDIMRGSDQSIGDRHGSKNQGLDGQFSP